jgi:polygalacturonase
VHWLIISTVITTTTSVPTTSTTTAVQCTATVYAEIAPAVAGCTDITLKDIYAPSNSSIDLSKLKAGAVVTFAGTTTFGFTNVSTFDPIIIAGKGITIKGAPGHLIDGNGQVYVSTLWNKFLYH